MSGVYGAQLAYFPELFDDYEVFRMAPQIGAGFGARIAVGTFSGYFSRNKGGQESVVTELRTENQKATFWAEDEIPRSAISQGCYIEDDGELYQFLLDNGYVREGGFVRHGLQLVVGNNDKQKPHARVNLGLDEYK
jgi:hypothetical protein